LDGNKIDLQLQNYKANKYSYKESNTNEQTNEANIYLSNKN